jgi:hypothetical protein
LHSRFHLESPLGSIIRVLEDLDDPRKAPQRIYKGRVGWGIPNFAIRSLDPRDCSMALWPRSTSRLIAHPSSELTCHGPCHDRGLSRAFCQSSSFLRPRIRKSSVTSRIEPQTQQPPYPPGPLPARLPRRTAASAWFGLAASVLIPRWHGRFGFEHPPYPVPPRARPPRKRPAHTGGLREKPNSKSCSPPAPLRLWGHPTV